MESPLPLWMPSAQVRNDSNLTRYQEWLMENYNLSFSDYNSLWQWSVDNVADFWQSLWKYFNVQFDGSYTQVIKGDTMPFISWFDGTSLNYAEHVFRKYN